MKENLELGAQPFCIPNFNHFYKMSSKRKVIHNQLLKYIHSYTCVVITYRKESLLCDQKKQIDSKLELTFGF